MNIKPKMLTFVGLVLLLNMVVGTSAAYNVVANGSFENGSQNWTFVNTSTSNSVYYDGSTSARMTKNTGYISQTVTVFTSDMQYFKMAHVEANSYSGLSIIVQFHITKTDGSTTVHIENFASYTSWNVKTIYPSSFPSGTYKITAIDIFNNTPGSSGTDVYVDYIKIMVESSGGGGGDPCDPPFGSPPQFCP